ncbi:SurA N- domain family protein [Afipia sp. Root123D2]|uniref:peptidylprolyl isomerase n=1 Tax=Afipia sp. Root123D2 TaxID=1736436 RepID=UPI0006F569C1|nr:peptidylprolyl isomerase [Afipia sp. Root123D2]KQW23249.1 SurA N- domain family protein [Afipia sp. Root123D2]
MMTARFLSSLTSGIPLMIAALMFVAQPSPAQAQVVVMVNGEPITDLDIQQRSKLIALTMHKSPSRKEVIQELIDDKIKIKEAKKFTIDLSASDVDNAYAGMGARMRLSPDQLSKVLESKGIRPETLKARLKAETAWNALIRGRFQQSLMVGEQDVRSAIPESNGQQADSFEYRMRPIMLVVARGSSATIESRRREAEALRNRIQSCDEALSIFRTLRDAAIRDLVVKTSADLPPALRQVLDKTPIGHLTAPEVTKQGIEMVALCDRKPTTADAPAKKEARDKLYVQKFEAKSKDYLEDLRKGAMIEYRR